MNTTLAFLAAYAIIIICIVTMVNKESYALPFATYANMQQARLTPSQCTQDCILRLRDRDTIDIQCANMCKNQRPSTFDIMANCGYAYGGYATKPCTNNQTYERQLQDDLQGSMEVYKYGMIQ